MFLIKKSDVRGLHYLITNGYSFVITGLLSTGKQNCRNALAKIFTTITGYTCLSNISP